MLNDGGEATAEVTDEDVEVATMVWYDPGFDAGIPHGKAESEHELDVGVVFGHAENEAAGCNFKGDGVMGSRNGKKGWGY